MTRRAGHPPELLLVEDNPADVRLTMEALRSAEAAPRVHVAGDGEEAIAFLRGEGEHAGRPRPDLVLLDLNLPRMDGCEVLAAVKSDRALRAIPVLVLSTSADERDVRRCYELHANCFITKPVDLIEFFDIIAMIERFWLGAVRLPDAVERTSPEVLP
jgi:CheY-like chemotaxis protein